MAYEALLYKKMDAGNVQCICCAHRCLIKEGEKGKCLVRENQGGQLFTKTYGKIIAQHVDPIEKKPLYHFYPGSMAYSIASPGCNFSCQWCQNWEISQLPKLSSKESGYFVAPEEIVKRAQAQRCTSIAYTYTEPTVFFEYTYDISKLAKNAGIKNVYVTNGYMTPDLLELYLPWLDAANVDIKAYSDATYIKHIGAHLKPVLENCIILKKAGVWIEITTLIIPGINDDDTELQGLAKFIVDELGKDTPWHLSRFYPNYQFESTAPTPIKTLEKAQ